MTTEASGAALLSRRYGPPIWLFERSAAARAKASQSTVDEILNGWVEGAGSSEAASPTEAASLEEVASPQTPDTVPTEAASEQPPAASPTATTAGVGLTGAALLTAVAEARGMPESLVERSAQARASAAGVSLDAVLHEWAEEEGLEAASDQPPVARPKAAASTPLPTPKPKPKPDAPAATGLTGAALLTAVAEARGMPESLVERSAKARAKKTDASVDDVLNEWAAEAGLGFFSRSVDSGVSPTSFVESKELKYKIFIY